MEILRNITPQERQQLELQGCNATNWDDVWVSDDFTTDQLSAVRFSGCVEIESGARIVDSYIANYTICEDAVVEGVTRLECRQASSFGNGVAVSTINENGGRSVMIYDGLSANVAYLWAMNRHRTPFVERLNAMVAEYAAEVSSTMGRVGARSRVIGARFVREVVIGCDVEVDGASLLEGGTILDGGYVGVDVKARSFIFAEDSRVDTGASVERCFVGERSVVAVGFSAVDSLIFANSHLENGEAAAIFAGPCTVSHHKSSLLIAGLFSFFNAGSGSNQSNHLFKSGAVHQAIHLRGCKFASGAYVMAPAREGAFTMIKGAHSKHHDTASFPYSYLIESGGVSMLMPGANLVSYGTQRDIEKWSLRDRRSVRRDAINYEEHNPYMCGAMVSAVNALHGLSEKEADEYMWERVVIRRAQLRRGLGLYNKAIAASIGAMLSRGAVVEGSNEHLGEWIDVAGAYLPARGVERLMSSVESGNIESLDGLCGALKAMSDRYTDNAHMWAKALLEDLLGHAPSSDEIAATIDSARSSDDGLRRQRESDGAKDSAMSTAVGYGNDWSDEQIREADFRAVRGLDR